MKKISYFGKEYTIGDDVKWVVTCPNGNVIAFTEFPRLYCGTWVSHEDGKRIGIWGGATEDWENSLRKVEDIIVKENELRDGEFKIKCIDNKGNPWFRVGSEYKAWYEDTLLYSDSERDTCYHSSLNNGHGVFEIVEEEKSHPHADLMLKYAQIAQYDDKPWECFEFKNEYSDGWMRVINPCWDIENEYRLKPQEPKIQVGQIWVSREGVDVVINVQSNKDTIVFMFKVDGMTYRNTSSYSYFLQNFKRKE